MIRITKAPHLKSIQSLSLLLVFLTISIVLGVVLELSGLFSRYELQTINQRFELRRWLLWSDAGLKRLNPSAIWNYHEHYEIPKRWWAWDYTLSWLVKDNHPPVKHKVVIFNHTLEDEPPAEAVETHPWMKPLLQYPISRSTIAEILMFLAHSGVRAIILDHDFPQYQAGDRKLAETITSIVNGKLTSQPIPVYMAQSISRHSFANVRAEVSSGPSGVLAELSKIDPKTNVLLKYTGTTCLEMDEDQVVRRAVLMYPNHSGTSQGSIIIKTLMSIGEPIPFSVPAVMDIDFSAPPNSELYPVRPFSYLLDPERKKAMVNPQSQSEDITLKGAIVFLGDGVMDLFSTPYTNYGVNLMSGPEVLVHALETVSRRSWPVRLSGWDSITYLIITLLAASCVIVGIRYSANPANSSVKRMRLTSIFLDLVFLISTVSIFYFIACLLFTFKGIIVPVIVPSLAIVLGYAGIFIWEREHARLQSLLQQLKSAQEKLILVQKTHKAELELQDSQAKAREIQQDRERRKDFVRRINHDLKGPIATLNLTLSNLGGDNLDAIGARDKVDRLARTSERLCDLVNELVRSYDHDNLTNRSSDTEYDLRQIVSDSAMVQRPLAESKSSQIELILPEAPVQFKGDTLSLSRVIDNLVRNAVAHNKSHTDVKIELVPGGKMATIVVSDTGSGIAPEHLKNIFDSGYKINGNGDKGLGLKIVKTLMEAMGGNVSVSSQIGQGTRFVLNVPVGQHKLGQDK